MSTKILTLAIVFFAACGSTPGQPCDVGDAGVDAEAGVVINCVAPNEHSTVNLVFEPNGSYSCLPGLCKPGWADCEGNPENGCDTDLSQPENCGACGNVCPTESVCAGGPGASSCYPSHRVSGGL